VPAELVSIIVLSHNKAAYTKRCLESVMAATYTPFELILVDNGSSDGTVEVLHDVQDTCRHGDIGCELILNDTNVGAVRGRNQALEKVRGRFIVFMDNDVEAIDPQWMQKLLNELGRQPRAGIVAPKLLFPGEPRRIECAGIGISRTGRVKYLGRGEPSDDPRFNRRRTLQAAISACWMMKADVFERCGFLDEAFNPVQYEDLDYCYRARSEGFEVLYTPDPEFVHYENVTTDGSRELNFKYLTIKHGILFKRKWHHMFSLEDGPPDEECRWEDLDVPRLP